MDRSGVALSLAVIDIACWAVCFVWMYRISKKQNAMLDALQAQAKRIEGLSKEEHALIKEVHPQVGEIKDSVDEVKAAVNRNA